jgi:NAD(P)-dependent dehydrogenase (short-subunit alcohol dehydrogenase family)
MSQTKLSVEMVEGVLPLAGRVAMVTGGSRGVGAMVAREVAAAGARVALTYMRSPDSAAQVVADIESAGGQAMSVYASAADEQSWLSAVDEVSARIGDVDLLVSKQAWPAAVTPSRTPILRSLPTCSECMRWVRSHYYAHCSLE